VVAAGVIAGDNRDAFFWNKKKKKERETEGSGISIPQFSIGLTYNAQPWHSGPTHTRIPCRGVLEHVRSPDANV
jgi:hypothetical protein